MIDVKTNRVLMGLLAVCLTAGVACGDDDENNSSNNATTNNATTNNATTNNATTNNMMTGDTARLQVIHNSPDPAAATVDVYVNDELYIDDFAFRTGTGFVEVPAGVELDVDIAGSDSSSSDDRINPDGAFTYTLAADSYTTIVAQGVLDPADFTLSDDGADKAFNLLVVGDQKTAPADASTIEVKVVHGSPDAPAVDALLADGTPLIDGAAYGDVTPYLPVPGASVVTLDITTDDQTTRAASFQTTGGVQGVTATALASGFLDADTNGGEAFGLYVFLGTDAETASANPGIPLPQAARLQVIHNSADPAAASVDIFVNDVETVPNFDYATATPYITVPSSTDLDVDIAAAADGNTSADRVNADDAFVFNLDPGSTTVLIASGFLNPGQFENPAGTDTNFNLYPVAGQEMSSDANEFQFNVFHGATDAPAVDVAVNGDVNTLIVDGAAYGDATGLQGVPGGEYTFDVLPAGGAIGDSVATYGIDVTGFVGMSFTVVASGFLTPDDGTGDPDIAFGLNAYTPAGGDAVPIPLD